MKQKLKLSCILLALIVCCVSLDALSGFQQTTIVLPSGNARLAGRFYFRESVIATSGALLSDDFCEETDIPPLPFDSPPHFEDGELWASLKLPNYLNPPDPAAKDFFGQFGQSRCSNTATVWGVIKEGAFIPKFTLPPLQAYSMGMIFKLKPTDPYRVDIQVLDFKRKTEIYSIKGAFLTRLPVPVAYGFVIHGSKLIDVAKRVEICQALPDDFSLRGNHFVNSFAIVDTKTREATDIHLLGLKGTVRIKDDCVEFYDKCGDCPNYDKLDKPTTITKIGFDGRIISQKTAGNIPNEYEVIDTENAVLLCRSLKPPASKFFIIDEKTGKILFDYEAKASNYPRAKIEKGIACVIDGDKMASFDIKAGMTSFAQLGQAGSVIGESGSVMAVSSGDGSMRITDAEKTVLCQNIETARPAIHVGSPTAQFVEDGFIYSFYTELVSESISYEFQISYLRQKTSAKTQGKKLFLPEWLTRFKNTEAFAFRNDVLYYAQDYGKLCSVNLKTFEKKDYAHQAVKYPQNFNGVAVLKLDGDNLYALYPGRNSIFECVDIGAEKRIFSTFLQLSWNALLGANLAKPLCIRGDNYILGPVRTAFNRKTGEVREYSGELIGVDDEAAYFASIGNEKIFGNELVRLDLGTWAETRKSIDKLDAAQLAANSSRMAFGTVFKLTGERIRILPDCSQKTIQSGLPKNLSMPIGKPDSFIAVSIGTHLIRFEKCAMFDASFSASGNKITAKFTPFQKGAAIPGGKIAIVPLYFDDDTSLAIDLVDIAWQTFNPLKSLQYSFDDVKSKRYAFVALSNSGFYMDDPENTTTIPLSLRDQASFNLLVLEK